MMYHDPSCDITWPKHLVIVCDNRQRSETPVLAIMVQDSLSKS
jgi:hypothetical protein